MTSSMADYIDRQAAIAALREFAEEYKGVHNG